MEKTYNLLDGLGAFASGKEFNLTATEIHMIHYCAATVEKHGLTDEQADACSSLERLFYTVAQNLGIPVKE